MPDHDLQRDLPDMLRQTADAIPSTIDISSAVQQRIDSGNVPSHLISARMLSRNFIAAASAVVIVALFSAVLLHHPASPPSNGLGPVGVVSAPSVHCAGQSAPVRGIACPVTDRGITFQVTGAYADAFRTSVTFVISGAPSVVHDPAIGDAQLVDAQGDIFADGGGSGYSGKNPQRVPGETDFMPLPVKLLHQKVQLTLTVKSMMVQNPPAPSGNPFVTGTWQSTFTVTPVPGAAYQVSMTPVVQNGIGMQVLSLEVAPPAPGNLVTPDPITIPFPRGVRMVVRVTGLPANTPLQSLLLWSGTTQTLCASREQGQCVMPIFGILNLPGWTLQSPANDVALPLTPPVTQPTVGPAGTVTLALLYPGQGTVRGNTATLDVSNFPPATNAMEAPGKNQLTWHLVMTLTKHS